MNFDTFRKVDNYLEGLFHLEYDDLKKTAQSIYENKMPDHAVSAVQGQFLFFLAKLCNAKKILEIGTLAGYSSIWLGKATGVDGKVFTIENNPKYSKIASVNIKEAQLENTIQVIEGEALSILDGYDFGEGLFDIFFMDADKPNYVNYFNWAIEKVRPGGLIVADNVIRDGKILELDSTDEYVIGVQNYLELLSKRTDIHTTILQQVGSKTYDGIALSLVK